MISNKVNFDFISEHKDKEGRYIMVKGKIDGVLVSLLNVYIPPGSDWAFYKQVLGLFATQSQGIPICGGNFNIRLHPKMDSSNGSTKTKSIINK